MKKELKSVLIKDQSLLVGDLYEGREIKEVHKLELFINRLCVLSWYVYGSKIPHTTKWLDGTVKETHDYHFSSSAFYPDTLFSQWGKYLHKCLSYKIGEDCGFDSPRIFADFLISKYSDGFSGCIISFEIVNY